MIYVKDLFDGMRLVMDRDQLSVSYCAKQIGIEEYTLRLFLQEKTCPAELTRLKIQRFLRKQGEKI